MVFFPEVFFPEIFFPKHGAGERHTGPWRQQDYLAKPKTLP